MLATRCVGRELIYLEIKGDAFISEDKIEILRIIVAALYGIREIDVREKYILCISVLCMTKTELAVFKYTRFPTRGQVSFLTIRSRHAITVRVL